MEIILKNLQIVFGLLAGLGIFVGSIAYVIEKYSKGRKDTKNEEVSSADTLKDFWKKQADDYKQALDEERRNNKAEIEKITSGFHIQFQDLKERFGVLKGQYEAEKTQREKAEEILKGRDPETKQFMETMLKATKDHDESHKKITEALNSLLSMAKEEKDRDIHISATVSKDGKA